MIELSPGDLSSYRARTYALLPELKLKSAEDAVDFVNRRGFVFFWPIKGVELPSLWTAAAGDRPVPDEHDDPGHMTWGWKDELLGKRRWYYARILRRRNTMISLVSAPYFYALSPNYGDPENDYLEQYEQGLMTLETRLVFEALLKEGPLDTLALRRAARLTSSDSTGRFNKALDDLQVEFKVLPVGISEAGAWRYAFIYDLTTRHFPEIQEQARFISEPEARRFLLRQYFISLGAAPIEQAARLFGWTLEHIHHAIKALIKAKVLVEDIAIPNQKGVWVATRELLDQD